MKLPDGPRLETLSDELGFTVENPEAFSRVNRTRGPRVHGKKVVR